MYVRVAVEGLTNQPFITDIIFNVTSKLIINLQNI